MDVIVIGGGPAGSATAIRLQKAGLRVRLYEKAVFPRVKLCGGFLSPESLSELAELGVLESIYSAGALPVNRVRISSPKGTEAEVPLPAPGLSLSRDLLDTILLQRASEIGVAVHQGTEGPQHRDEENWTVMATGRKLLTQRSSYYAIQAFFEEVEGISNQVELDLIPGGYIGLVRQGTNRVNLCAFTSQRVLQEAGPSLDAVLARWREQNPVLASHISGARRVSSWQAVGPVSMGLRKLAEGNQLFVGDASCVVDPFVGEGIAMSLKSAALIQNAFLQTARPVGEAYAHAWHEMFNSSLRVGRWLRAALNQPLLQEVCVRGLKAFPPLLGRLTEWTRPHGNLQPYPDRRAV